MKPGEMMSGVANESQIDDVEQPKGSSKNPDWERIVRWLQTAAIEIEYLAWRAYAMRTGGMPEEAPSVFVQSNDMEDEPLTEKHILARIKEICGLADGWRISATFPNFYPF